MNVDSSMCASSGEASHWDQIDWPSATASARLSQRRVWKHRNALHRWLVCRSNQNFGEQITPPAKAHTRRGRLRANYYGCDTRGAPFLVSSQFHADCRPKRTTPVDEIPLRSRLRGSRVQSTVADQPRTTSEKAAAARLPLRFISPTGVRKVSYQYRNQDRFNQGAIERQGHCKSAIAPSRYCSIAPSHAADAPSSFRFCAEAAALCAPP